MCRICKLNGTVRVSNDLPFLAVGSVLAVLLDIIPVGTAVTFDLQILSGVRIFEIVVAVLIALFELPQLGTCIVFLIELNGSIVCCRSAFDIQRVDRLFRRGDIERNIRLSLKDQLVIRIPADIFAAYDAGRMLGLLQKEYMQHIDESIGEENIPLRSIYDNPYRILTIAVISHRQQTRFGYRIYDHGSKTLDKEVIKPDITLQDLFDLLDYVMMRHHNIDAIGISLPGVANHGFLNLEHSDFDHYNLADAITKRYHHPAIILNDVNAMALGYHAMHEDSDDMAFCFMPHGQADLGAGLIMDGKLRLGYAHHAGEMHHLLKAFCPNISSDNITPESTRQLLVISILSLISTLAPARIVYYCELCPDPDEICNALAEYIEPAYIPEIIHVNRLKRYQLPGTMIRCLEVLNRHTIKEHMKY